MLLGSFRMCLDKLLCFGLVLLFSRRCWPMGKTQTERKSGFTSELCHSHPAWPMPCHWLCPQWRREGSGTLTRWELCKHTASPSVSIPRKRRVILDEMVMTWPW